MIKYRHLVIITTIRTRLSVLLITITMIKNNDIINVDKNINDLLSKESFGCLQRIHRFIEVNEEKDPRLLCDLQPHIFLAMRKHKVGILGS